MSRASEQPDSFDIDLPDTLRGELARAYRVDVQVPRELDHAILEGARQDVARRRQFRRLLRWAGAGAAAAAAAAVGLVLVLRQPGETPSPLAQSHQTTTDVRAGDVDRNGRVDILDALVLAKKVEANATSDAQAGKLPVLRWEDVNLDGVVNDTDVDRIAAAAVNATGGTIQ